jgi:hypothetical protein
MYLAGCCRLSVGLRRVDLTSQELDLAPPWWRFGFDGKALVETVVGSVVGLIALFSSYDHVSLPHRQFPLQQLWGESGSSLPPFRSFLTELRNAARHLGATLNWRRDPVVEMQIALSEQRTKQLESEIELLKNETERLK